jgi:flagellar hook-associated protein 1
MGLLNGSLQIGRTALLAHQSAMQVIGNNVANAGNADYTRQSPRLSPIYGSKLPEGFDSGAGVQLTGIERHIDEALEQRLRQSLSDRDHDDLISQTLSRLETLYDAMGDTSLAKGLDNFFNAFSKLQSTPQDVSARSVVTQEGDALASQIRTMRQDIVGVYNEMTDLMSETVDSINQLTGQIADLNVRIANAKSGGDTAGALMDKRDALLKDLSSLTDINVVHQDNGEVTVYIDTDPLIQSNQARTLKLQRETNGDLIKGQMVFADNNRKANVTGGKAGAINELITTLIGGNLKNLDTFASGLIFELNKLHAAGQGLHGYTTLTSSNAVTNPAAPINQAGLDFAPQNGSFLVTVKDANTNQQTMYQINVDLNGLAPETTLNTLAAQISAIPNVTATVQANGQLNLATSSDQYTLTFSEDSSNVLAALGLNTFFTGRNAADIELNPDLADDPQFVACAQNNLPGDGTNAAAMSLLRTVPVASLNELSITDYYRSIIGGIGTQTASARQRLDVHAAIADTLQAQRETISGVSLDEETVNLLSNQRAFQGAAKFISIVNEMLQEVMQFL